MYFFKKNLIDITIFILLQYILITVILILLYSGGNPINPYEHTYIFNLNYLSDLGRHADFTNQPNPFCIFYCLTMVLTGIGTVLYFYLISWLIEYSKIRKFIFILGIIVGLGYTLIGIFPADINLNWHLTVGMTAFYISIFANLMINFFIKKEVYPYIFYTTTFLNILLIGRVLFNITIDFFNLTSEELLKSKVITQKIVIYSQVIIVISILYYIKRKRFFCYEN